MAAEALEASDPDERTVRVVEFTLGGERFAVEVGDVDNIEELAGLTRIPRTGEAIEGVMDLRGEITAIIDLRAHLDVEGEVPNEPQVLVVDQSKDKQKLGLKVDRINRVEPYAESEIEDASEVPDLGTAGVEQRIIEGIIQGPAEGSDFEPIAMIDVDEIVRRSRQGR